MRILNVSARYVTYCRKKRPATKIKYRSQSQDQTKAESAEKKLKLKKAQLQLSLIMDRDQWRGVWSVWLCGTPEKRVQPPSRTAR